MPQTLLVKNAQMLVTMDGQRREIPGGGLHAEDGILTAVGDSASLPDSADTVTGSGAADGLLDEARHLRTTGDLSGSLARLDRALRIAPQNALVYLELARSHAAAGAPARASASAERGLLYCRGSVCAQLRRFIDS